MTAPVPRRRIDVAVLTFRRRELLAVMLPGIVGQAAASAHDVSVIVVDNDPARSAADVVGAAARDAASHGVAVRYVPEPTPGIAAARNRALDAATAVGADAVVFVDDDVQVQPGWFDALTGEWVSSGAAAVAGANIWPADLDLPPWVEASGFYRRPRRPTGTVMASFATANVLIDLAAARRAQLRFDLRFGVSGGEDTLFARSLVASGGVVRWCDEAVTVEAVPAERRTRDFVLRRDRNRAGTWVQVVLLVTPPRRRRLRWLALAARAAGRAGRGALRWTVAVLRRDLAARAGAERSLAKAVGMAAGLTGRRGAQYGSG